MKIIYDQEVDVLRVLLSGATIAESAEDRPGVVIDCGADGKVVGIEILDASKRMENPRSVEYTADTPAAAPPQREPVVVLAVFANPQDTAPLRWKQEERALRDCLDPLGNRFRLEARTSASPDELHQALLRHSPQILHFSGHGEEAGLLFETRSGDRQLVPRADLVTLLHNSAKAGTAQRRAIVRATHIVAES